MKNISLTITAVLLAGCVTTNTTGYVDPDYRKSGYEVSKVVIQVTGATMEETQIAEQKLSEKFNAHNVETIKYTDIVPPTRNYSDQKIVSLINKTGADSLFSISIGKDIVESYVPATYHPGTTTSQVNTVGNYSYVTTSTSPGYTTGGYSTSSPVMASLSNLVDLKKRREVWRAEGQASGDNSWTSISFADLLVSIGSDAIDDLVEKGLLPVIPDNENLSDTENTEQVSP